MPVCGITIWSRKNWSRAIVSCSTRALRRAPATWRSARSAASGCSSTSAARDARCGSTGAERTKRFRSTAIPKRGCWVSLRSSSKSGGSKNDAPGSSSACLRRSALCERRAIKASYFPENYVPVEGLLDLNEELIPNPVSTFFGRVKGISLIDDDIEDSDSVIVDRMLEPRWGDLAVCVTPDGFTMKYVEVRDNGEVWLMPGNKDFAPLRITDDNERLLWGIVTHSIRQLRVKKGGKK